MLTWETVSLPITKAYPAEFMLANLACHMIVAFVLLEQYFAIGATLGILSDILNTLHFIILR
jgi:hypothetical protein